MFAIKILENPTNISVFKLKKKIIKFGWFYRTGSYYSRRVYFLKQNNNSTGHLHLKTIVIFRTVLAWPQKARWWIRMTFSILLSYILYKCIYLCDRSIAVTVAIICSPVTAAWKIVSWAEHVWSI